LTEQKKKASASTCSSPTLFHALSPYPVKARDKPISKIIKRGSAKADPFFIGRFSLSSKAYGSPEARSVVGIPTANGAAPLLVSAWRHIRGSISNVSISTGPISLTSFSSRTSMRLSAAHQTRAWIRDTSQHLNLFLSSHSATFFQQIT
jgi:hypothetical protein